MTYREQGDVGQPGRPSLRKPPPNYRSRQVQLQLFVLVVALMTVLVAMNEARKPETWAWLWGRNGDGNDAPIDSRLPLDPHETELSRTSPAGADADAEPKQAIVRSEAAEKPDQQFVLVWHELYSKLDRDEKQDLASLLRSVRLDHDRRGQDQTAWKALIEKLDAEWHRFIAEQGQALSAPESQLLASQQERAATALREVERRWSEQHKPALVAAAEDRVAQPEREVLAELQAILDEANLEAVRDDTVWRADEREAWFRLLEQLQNKSEQELSKASIGEVNFVQLFRQSQEYRGKPVTVRGTARLGYRISAPPNDLGINGYYLLWLKPADGTNVPIVVYTLQLPQGFAPLSEKEQTQLRHEIEVDGFFFKRWVYRAADGINSVPLLVAKVPKLIQKPVPQESLTDALSRRLDGGMWVLLAAVVVVLAGLATLLTWLAARSSRAHVAATVIREGESVEWDKLPAGESVEESLRRLEQENE